METQTKSWGINGNLLLYNLMAAIGLLFLPTKIAAQYTPVHSIGSLPATCQGGSPYIFSDEVVLITGGVGQVYVCSSTNTWTLVGSGASSAWSTITAGSNLNILTMGTGGSLTTINLGQIAGNQNWIAGGIVAPIITTANSGGSFNSSHTYIWQYTFTSSLGESLPSGTTTGATGIPAPCASASCTATLVAPSLGAYSSYSVYLCDLSSGPCTAPQKVAACTNITTNCVLTTPQTTNTSSVPAIDTALIQPPNIQATNGPPGLVPTIFFQKPDNNYYPWIGVDAVSNNGTTGGLGTPTFTHRTYFNDCPNGFAGVPEQTYKNAFISVNHCLGTGTVITNQDRGLAIQVSGLAGDSTTHYAIEGIQAEADWVGTESFNGSPDGEVTAGSFQTSDTHTGLENVNGYHVNGVRVSVNRSSTGTTGSCTPCYNGVYSEIYNNSNSSTNSAWAYAAFTGTVYSNSGSPSDNVADFYGLAPSSKGLRFGGSNIGLYMQDFGTNAADFDSYFVSTNGNPTSGRNWMGGNLYVPNLLTAATTIGVTGSMVVTGSVSGTQLATPTSPSVSNVGTSGTTTYTYAFVGVDGNGNTTPQSSTTPTTSGNATLNSSNYNNICLGGINNNLASGYSSIQVFRTASGGTPSSTGKIGTITPTNTDTSRGPGLSGTCLADQGLAGDSSTGPTINTTGAVKQYKELSLSNCGAVGTAANPSVVSCVAASVGSFSCATNASTGTCVVNTTAITASSQIFIQEDASLGTRLGVTCNTNSITTTSAPISARSTGVSFTLNLGTITTNPECFSYKIVN